MYGFESKPTVTALSSNPLLKLLPLLTIKLVLLVEKNEFWRQGKPGVGSIAMPLEICSLFS